MATNKDLKEFRDSLKSELLARRNKGGGTIWIIDEHEDTSNIKELHMKFTNKDDAIVIGQTNKLPTIQCLFNKEVKSCDFIVLICDSGKINVCFCELKSSLNKDSVRDAAKQIESSKIFFEYLHKFYQFQYKKPNFFIDLENSKNLYIYPASISQKTNTHFNKRDEQSLSIKFKPIKISNDGKYEISNAYEFFKS